MAGNGPPPGNGSATVRHSGSLPEAAASRRHSSHSDGEPITTVSPAVCQPTKKRAHIKRRLSVLRIRALLNNLGGDPASWLDKSCFLRGKTACYVPTYTHGSGLDPAKNLITTASVAVHQQRDEKKGRSLWWLEHSHWMDRVLLRKRLLTRLCCEVNFASTKILQRDKAWSSEMTKLTQANPSLPVGGGLWLFSPVKTDWIDAAGSFVFQPVFLRKYVYFDEIDLSGFAIKFKLSTEAYQYVLVGKMHESWLERGQKNSMLFDLNQILQLEHPPGPSWGRI